MAYSVNCKCQAIRLSLHNQPIVHAYCHCSDCRELLNNPFHSVTAWKEKDVKIETGVDLVAVYQHPTLKMQKYFCKNCGEVIFNTNVMNWRVVSQLLIAKSYQGKLPKELASNKHFFYEQRVIDINDDLRKYLRGTSGPLYEQESGNQS